jgi:hypothetical protein
VNPRDTSTEDFARGTPFPDSQDILFPLYFPKVPPTQLSALPLPAWPVKRQDDFFCEEGSRGHG